MNLTDEIRLEAAKRGIFLWRNNVGACKTEDGRFIRFGLANDSEKVNDVLKSADLIGIRPLIITQEMVGKKIGVFTSVEVKKYAHELTAKSGRIVGQKNWKDLIARNGGVAIITNTLDKFLKAIYYL